MMQQVGCSQTLSVSTTCSRVRLRLECSLNTTSGLMRSNRQSSVQCKRQESRPGAEQLTQLYICAQKIATQIKEIVETFMMAVRLAILLNYEKQRAQADKFQLATKRAQTQLGSTNLQTRAVAISASLSSSIRIGSRSYSRSDATTR